MNQFTRSHSHAFMQLPMHHFLNARVSSWTPKSLSLDALLPCSLTHSVLPLLLCASIFISKIFLFGIVSSNILVRQTCTWDKHVRETNMHVKQTCTSNKHARETNMYVRQTCTWNKHARVTNMYVKQTCTWDKHARETNMHVKQTCMWNNWNKTK